MPLVSRLALLPPNARAINDDLAMLKEDQCIVFFNAAGPIYSCMEGDRTGIRLAAVTLIRQRLAGVSAIARALGLHRSTISRHLKEFDAGGADALVGQQRGPKHAHKLTPTILREAQRLLDDQVAITDVAKELGVSRRAIYHAFERGLLIDPRLVPAPVHDVSSADAPSVDAPGPGVRAEEDQACEPGVAVKRTLDRGLAASGKLLEATPEFLPAEGVRGAGVLLALPELLQQGLIETGVDVYGSLRKGFFGLRTILLTFAFMALLRIRTPEQLTEHAPGELGRLLGLDRMPEVKTLRRKLAEMGERRLGNTFRGKLTERWAKAEPREMAILYIDGHVRPYNGRTHTLPKCHVQQRGRPMPATKDFHMGNRRADPLLFVTAEATEGLLWTLDSTLLPEVRKLVGPRRRITIAFDREGWSPDLFAKWQKEKFDVLTYRKGKQTTWQVRFFREVKGKVGGQSVKYCLAEREVKLPNGLKVREIRRLCENGHQTAVITTNKTLPLLQVAHRMFSRWRQENFFRYMRYEFALDHLCTYNVEAADPARLVASPERKALQKKLKAVRAARATLIDRRLDLVPGKKARVGNVTLDEDQIDQRIETRETEIKDLKSRIAAMPTKVPLGTVLEPDKIVQLERERKILVDVIKLTAYRAESALARLIVPLFPRHDDEGRKFLKTVFQATADILPDAGNKVLTIRFHGLASPRATRSLAALCLLMSERNVHYPGTDLRLRFEAPMSQK